MKFYYYKGNWQDGKSLLFEATAPNITEADKLFAIMFAYDPSKAKDISVTLEKLTKGIDNEDR